MFFCGYSYHAVQESLGQVTAHPGFENKLNETGINHQSPVQSCNVVSRVEIFLCGCNLSEQNKTTFLIVNFPPPLQWMTPFCAGLERILFLEKPMKLVKNKNKQTNNKNNTKENNNNRLDK